VLGKVTLCIQLLQLYVIVQPITTPASLCPPDQGDASYRLLRAIKTQLNMPGTIRLPRQDFFVSLPLPLGISTRKVSLSLSISS
jgi:hypothetical protein